MYASTTTSPLYAAALLRLHCTGTTSTMPCAAATSSCGCTGSTSTLPCVATTHLLVASAIHHLCRAPRLLVTQLHGLYLNLVMRRHAARLLVGRSHWLSPCTQSLRLAARLLVVRITQALLPLCRASGRAVSPLDFLSVGHTGSRRASGHCVSRCDYSSSGLHRLYYAYAVHPDAPSQCSTSLQSVALAIAMCPVIPLCIVTTRLVAATDILRLRRASGCFDTSRGLSRGSSSTTSPTPHLRVPWHIARLVTWLVVDYFAYTACPGATACHAAHHAARRRLLRLRRASGCLGTSRGSSSGSSSTTSTTPRIRVPRHVAHLVAPLVVDYFTYVVQLGASARRAARRAARHTAPRRLLRLCRAFGCLRTSRGSSSTTSPTPRQHIARLVVDYFTYAARPGALARRAAHHATHRRLLRLRRAFGCLGTSRGSTSTTSPTSHVWVPWHFAWLVVDYSAHAACPGASAHRAAHRSARRAARRRLLCLRRASGCLGSSRGSSRGSS
jgi:hypothetical protein